MHMKKFFLYTLFVAALAGFGVVATQADRIDADFLNADDADAFVAAAEDRGQGRGAQVTHNEDGTTSVGLPEVATEMMAETAMDAIAEHANAVVIAACPCEGLSEGAVVWDNTFEALRCLLQPEFELTFVDSSDGGILSTQGISISGPLCIIYDGVNTQTVFCTEAEQAACASSLQAIAANDNQVCE
jgi:hypothetical protein